MKRFLAVLCCFLMLSAASAEGLQVPADSAQFDSALALALLDISSLAFETHEQADYMKKLGFDCVFLGNYDAHADRHVAAYGVYTGVIDGRDAVLVSVRGTGEGEWPLNIELAPSGDYGLDYAENFFLAAQDIFQAQTALFASLAQPLFLVTGHSRGAAVGNMLAAMLSDRYGGENVYAYTIATPRTVRGEKKSYPNIFNLVNPSDYVTYMPLPQWGFERYGVDVTLEARDAAALEAIYGRRGDTFGLPFTLFKEGAQTTLRLISAMAALAPTAEAGYVQRHSLNGPGLAAADEEGMTAGEVMLRLCSMTAGSALPLLFDLARMKANYTDFDPLLNIVLEMALDGELAAMACAHTPALYAALLCEEMP